MARSIYGANNNTARRRPLIASAPDGEVIQVGEMEMACIKAFEDMPWLKESDEVMKRLVIKYARLMDGPEGAYMTFRLGPHLLEALKQMAATPTARFSLFGNEKSTSGKLAELRAKREAS